MNMHSSTVRRKRKHQTLATLTKIIVARQKDQRQSAESYVKLPGTNRKLDDRFFGTKKPERQ